MRKMLASRKRNDQNFCKGGETRDVQLNRRSATWSVRNDEHKHAQCLSSPLAQSSHTRARSSILASSKHAAAAVAAGAAVVTAGAA